MVNASDIAFRSKNNFRVRLGKCAIMGYDSASETVAMCTFTHRHVIGSMKYAVLIGLSV